MKSEEWRVKNEEYICSTFIRWGVDALSSRSKVKSQRSKVKGRGFRWKVDAVRRGGFATMAIGDGYNYGVWKSWAAVWKCSDGVWKCMLNPSTTRHSFSGGGRRCVKNTNALFYCYFLTVSCHSERSEESDNVCFIFLLMFTDSSLRSEWQRPSVFWHILL